jgi:hypothetical protein
MTWQLRGAEILQLIRASFRRQEVVRTAFLAGNDLLYMDEILSTGDEDFILNREGVLEFFARNTVKTPLCSKSGCFCAALVDAEVQNVW